MHFIYLGKILEIDHQSQKVKFDISKILFTLDNIAEQITNNTSRIYNYYVIKPQ